MLKQLVLTAGLAIAGPTATWAHNGLLGDRPSAPAPLVTRVHSVGEAEAKLHRRGYYDIVLERSSLPYSFSACKRGIRYHIHVDYYGDFVAVDETGGCRERSYGYRVYDSGPRYAPYYSPYEPRPWYRRSY